MLMLFLISVALGQEPATIGLTPGYIYKFRCEGRLLVSGVGSDSLIRLEPLPKELGCGVLVKPLGRTGTSNLILETSTGTVSRLIEVRTSTSKPRTSDLEIVVQGGSEK